MAIQKFDADLNIISKLSDYPSEDGLETDAFKVKFDLGPNLLKDYINNTLIPEISKTVDEDTVKAEANAYTDASVRKAAPRNLLDNSDFTNLIAQAGIGGNHGSIAYAADRWILDSGTVSYAAGVGLTLNGTIRQKLEFPPTGETSAFVGMASGTASISYADGAVTITSSGGVLKWAALYVGVYTETTKPEYQSKGYGAELAECQRYYLHDVGKHCPGLILADGSIKVFVPTPVTMRITPTASAISLDNAVYNNGEDKIIALNSIASIELKTTGVYVVFNTALTAGQDMFHALVTFGTTLHLSADL